MTTALLFVAAAAAFQAEAGDVSPFCRDYNDVVSQAFRGFRKFRGIIEQGDDQKFQTTYHAVFVLPGARSCKIDETENRYHYKCSWQQTNTEDWAGTVAQARTLAKALADCAHVHMMEQEISWDKEDDGQNWRGFLRLPYAERLQVEVTAHNFLSQSDRLPKRLAGIHLTISYRRVSRP
jgi:hypothetical protein